MSSKTVPLSVRLSSDDAEFIARMSADGASTPSEKVRALIFEARRRREGYRDYRRCLAMAQETLAPAIKRLRDAERTEGVHSELVLSLGDWLPEAFAFFLTSLTSMSDDELEESLVAMEQGVADRIFWLMETVLRLGVTRSCRAYHPTVVAERLEPIIELAEVIRSTRSAETEAQSR